jgi:hypothetical protein
MAKRPQRLLHPVLPQVAQTGPMRRHGGLGRVTLGHRYDRDLPAHPLVGLHPGDLVTHPREIPREGIEIHNL